MTGTPCSIMWIFPAGNWNTSVSNELASFDITTTAWARSPIRFSVVRCP